ncbi:hypothetical protein LAZ67_8003421 [Cordylochernes scorpioides]|uniref:Reverse transcriptase Ty1/copia-type domain-containing protein n=1 Tax=Cordylochernes scorpioides TaxID=51811 RepID=A0ABY6KUR0_9ARAC|nr:hypothetical protein LAZ67_8003421 [Cordylochernes scorpioides]
MNEMPIAKCYGHNFPSWKYRVESILESKDLINILIEDPPGEESERQKWKIKDSQAKGHKANDCWHNPKKGNNNRREDLNKPNTSGYKPKFGNQQKQTGNSHNEKAANCLIAKNQEKSEHTDYSIIKIDGPAEEETNSSPGDEESSVEIQNPASNTRYNFRHTHRPGFYYEPSLSEEEYEENSIIQAPNDTLLMTQNQNHIPKTYKEAIECPQASKWTEAMKKEIYSLLEHHVLDIEPLPKGTKPIKSKWIFTIKNDPIIGKRYKSRLVAAGYSQKYGINYYRTFSPVISSDTLRILLCYAAKQNCDFKNYDIETAYLYGDLQEKQYMLQPEGFEMGDKNMVCKLKKAIYGLHQSAKVFYDTLKSHLLDEVSRFRASLLSLTGEHTPSQPKESYFKGIVFITLYLNPQEQLVDGRLRLNLNGVV